MGDKFQSIGIRKKKKKKVFENEKNVKHSRGIELYQEHSFYGFRGMFIVFETISH